MTDSGPAGRRWTIQYIDGELDVRGSILKPGERVEVVEAGGEGESALPCGCAYEWADWKRLQDALRAALAAHQQEPEDVNLLEDGHTQPPAMRQEAWATGEPPLEPCGPRGDEGRSVRPSSGEPGTGPLTPEEAAILVSGVAAPAGTPTEGLDAAEALWEQAMAKLRSLASTGRGTE